MKRQRNFLLLSTRQKNRIALQVNDDLLSCQQNTLSDNNRDNNSKSATNLINLNDQQSDFSYLDFKSLSDCST